MRRSPTPRVGAPVDPGVDAADFRAAWWLPGAHLQTIWGRLARPRRLVSLRREVIATPDDDEIIIDHLDGDPSLRFVLLHGLEGSSYSVYIQGLLLEIQRRGWSASVLNFRSCAREPLDWRTMILNKTFRLYHSGETGDIDFLVRLLHARDPAARLVAFGASLGGNVLLKWLGENPEQQMVSAAATVSVPYDLAAGARHLESRVGGLYVASFLRSLRRKTLDRTERFELAAERVDLKAMMKAKSFFEFDDAATAPLHGFLGAEDYYTRSSSIRFIERITTPTLCLSSADDPFLPPRVLRELEQSIPATIELRMTPRGGHVGFVGGSTPWRCRYWAEERIVKWLGRVSGASEAP